MGEPLSESVVTHAWQAALLDAGLNTGEVAFWPCTGFDQVQADSPAATFPAGREFKDERFERPAAEAGYPIEKEDRPRVALLVDFPLPDEDDSASPEVLLDGFLRHELEHVRQFAYWDGRGVKLYDLDHRLDGSSSGEAETLPCSTTASTWSKTPTRLHRSTSCVATRIGSCLGYSTRDVSPTWSGIGKVPAAWRTSLGMLAFCLLFPVAVRFYEETYQEPFGRELERYVPGAHARWNDLVAALSG